MFLQLCRKLCNGFIFTFNTDWMANKQMDAIANRSFLTVDNKVILKEIRIPTIVTVPAHLTDLTVHLRI